MIADNSQTKEGIEIRCIKLQELNSVLDIEECCSLPKVPSDRERILKTVTLVPEMTLVAVETATGRVVGFVQGFPTYERTFRKAFYKDSAFYNPNGDTLVIMAVNVIPNYRGAGIEKQLVYTLCINEFQNGRKRAVLLCHPMKVHMFEKLRFNDLGKTDIRRGGKMWHEMRLSMEKWGVMKCDACGNTSPMTLYDNGYDYCCELCGNRTDNETGKLHSVLDDSEDDIIFCE
nr:GNAT family N-acetyltransferase [Butyrivibrio sp. WCD3002]